MDRDHAQIWWDSITGPSRFVTQVADAIYAGCSVLLHMPEDLPWRKQMRSSTEARIKEDSSDLIVSYIDCETDILPNESIESFIFRRFSTPEAKDGYRASSKQTEAQYIRTEGILNDRVIWVKGLNAEYFEKWIGFEKGFHSTGRNTGLFIIEEHAGYQIKGNTGRIKSVDYKEYATYYDALLFNNMVVSERTTSTEWKQYIAALVTKLCRLDVELSDFMLRDDEMQVDIPVTTIESARYVFDKRAEADALPEKHPFRLLRESRMDDLHRIAWEAQMQVIFPLIEMERLAFVNAYREQVLEAISNEYWDNDRNVSRRIHQYGSIVTTPEEAEIGTLYRLTKLRQASDTYQYMLYLPIEADRHRLDVLHEMRNTIAHMSVCSGSLVREFLDGYQYRWHQ